MSNSKDHYSFVKETAINLFSILDQAQILLTQLLSRTKSTTSSDCNNNLDNNLVMRLEASLQEVHKRLDKLESPHSSWANPTNTYSNSNASGWNSPSIRRPWTPNSSGQTPHPTQNNNSIRIALFPGPKNLSGSQIYTHEQLKHIQNICRQNGISITYAGKEGNKIPLLSKPTTKPEQLFQRIQDLFPFLTPEISTNKWIKVFMHKIDSKDNQSFHAISSDRREQAKVLAETLRTNNDYPEDICNQHNIKVLSTSLGYSNKNIPSNTVRPTFPSNLYVNPPSPLQSG